MIIACRSEYQEEEVIVFNEWWPDPDALQLGSPLLIQSRRILLINGVFGNGTEDFPFYVVEVEQGTCSRFRFIAAMGEDTCKPLTSSIGLNLSSP